MAILLSRSLPRGLFAIAHSVENFELVLTGDPFLFEVGGNCGPVGLHPPIHSRTIWSPSSDTIPQLAVHLAHRSLSHIPSAFRPTHLHSPTPARSFSSCFFEHFTFRLRSYESEAVPIFHGSAPVLDTDITAETRIGTLSPYSPSLRKLFLFQKRLPRRPNCALTFGLCACGHIHAHLHALQPLPADAPLHVGDPPYHESDFVGSTSSFSIPTSSLYLVLYSSGIQQMR